MQKLLILLLSALSLTAVAQNDVKRVAILETVDKQGTVPYLKQLMFRSNLTTAITNTAGYEGYDRADLKEILGEQNFQRTGMVSDADIKKIGEFTCAKYVLIAEAVIDGSDMFITAKIIDVETARVLRNSNQLMGTSAADMQTGSQKVAADLLGASSTTSSHQTKVGNTSVPIQQSSSTSTHQSQQDNTTNIPINKSQSKAQNGTAKIIISRPFSSSGWNNMSATHMLYFDGQLFGNVPSTIYFEIIVEPGKHTIQGYIGNSSPEELRRAGAAYSLTIDAVKDNTYYACIDDKKKTLILVSRENHEKDLNKKYMPLKWAGKLELRGGTFYDMNGNPVGENAHKAHDNQ